MESRNCFKLFIKFEFKAYLTSAFSESLYADFTPNRTGQRGQIIHLLKVGDVIFHADSLELQFSVVLKHTRPGVHQHYIRFQSYIQNKSLCIVSLLREYIDRTSSLRGQ